MDEAYRDKWAKQIKGNVTFLEEHVEEGMVHYPELLDYKKNLAPLMYTMEITVYTNGIVTYRSDGFIVEEKHFTAQLDDRLLNEIERLMETKALQEQESCMKPIIDGSNSTLRLYLNNSMNLISNSNCDESEFSFEYRCLVYLLSRIEYEYESA